MGSHPNVSHYKALNQIALQHGYKNWGLLIRHHAEISSSFLNVVDLKRGGLVMVAGRPGNGKTVLSLKLIYSMVKIGWRAVFLSLEYTIHDLVETFARNVIALKNANGSFVFDDNDAISSDYIIETYGSRFGNCVFVVDYLQLLDQDRSKPTLQDQIVALKRFAETNDVVIIFLSQIDRKFELSEKALPEQSDIRLPNPLDTGLFDQIYYAKDGELVAA